LLTRLKFLPIDGGNIFLRKSINFYRSARNPIPDIVTPLKLYPNSLFFALLKRLKDLIEIKLSLCIIKKHCAMETYVGNGGIVPLFLTSALDGVE
jgi:hypothetical protein